MGSRNRNKVGGSEGDLNPAPRGGGSKIKLGLQIGPSPCRGLRDRGKHRGFYSKAMGSHWRVLSMGDILGLTQSKHICIQDHPLSLSLSGSKKVFCTCGPK